jgi:hypothetical protein
MRQLIRSVPEKLKSALSFRKTKDEPKQRKPHDPVDHEPGKRTKRGTQYKNPEGILPS